MSRARNPLVRWWQARQARPVSGAVALKRYRRSVRRNPFLAQLHWYEIVDDPIAISTRQAEAVNPALVATHPPLSGPPLGVDVEDGHPITLLPHDLYEADRTGSPNVVILGAVSTGKSSLLKTQYVLRPLALKRCQVVVFDRKRQSGRGEYYKAARAARGTTIRFDRSGGAVVNILDPRISATSQEDGAQQRVGQDELLRMVAEYAHGPLNSFEDKALREAHQAALDRAAGEGRVAVLGDVVDALYNPDVSAIPRPHLAERGIVTVDRVIEWGLGLALDLERFVEGDLSGLIDGETRAEDGGELDLSSRLIVVDTSALGEESAALGLVMAVMSTFLLASWATTPGRRIIAIEEGYHTTNLPGVSKVFRSIAKRGRGIGVSMVVAFHHISDVPDASDASSLIREAGIVHVYRQDKSDDAEAAIRLFGLPEWTVEDLMSLDVGRSMLKIGTETPRLVIHERTSLEELITSTDAAMAGLVEEDLEDLDRIIEEWSRELDLDLDDLENLMPDGLEALVPDASAGEDVA